MGRPPLVAARPNQNYDPWGLTLGGLTLGEVSLWRRVERGLARHTALFAEYFTQYLKVRVGYRGDFAIGVATSMAATIFALGFVLVLFSKVPRLADWSFNEV